MNASPDRTCGGIAGGWSTERLSGRLLAIKTLVALVAATGTWLVFPLAAAAAADNHIACGDVAGLKAAIRAAGLTPAEPTTIRLAAHCRYELTSLDNDENGLPVVASQITVMGGGSTIARSAASAAAFRIWDVGPTGSLTLKRLTMTGGLATAGGAIFNDQGKLRLVEAKVTGNTVRTSTTAAGGGIYNTGTADISASQIYGNSVRSSGDVAEGGGIENAAGSLTLRASQVFGNAVSSSADAGIGGGIDNGFGAALRLVFSQLHHNTATSTAPNQLGGGGAISNVGTAVLTGSQLHDNTANSSAGNARGGAISDVGRLTLNGSQVYDNTSSSAGVVGGGIYTGGNITVRSSQIYGNTANNTGTAPGEGSLGGGVFIAGGSDNSFTRGLIVANRAAGQGGQGGGIFLLGVAAVNLSATLVAANLPDNCFPPGSASGCTG